MEILRTSDYRIFKELKGNREISPTRVAKIIKSIETVGYIVNPIIVNEKMEIIDGQGRLKALMMLGLPVDYIIQEGLGSEQCIAMNIYQTNWTLIDYINSYAAKGNRGFVLYKQLLEKYPEFNCYVVATALKGITRIGNEVIKTGGLAVSDEEYNQAINKLEYLRRFNNLLPNVKGKKYYMQQALLYCYNFEDVDNERLYNKMEELIHSMGAFENINTCMEEIEKIYNKNRQNGYSFIVTDYKKSILERLGRGIKKIKDKNANK